MVNATPKTSTEPRTLLIVLGVLFTVVWIGAHLAWIAMSLMANLMANDSGAASTDQQMTLIAGMLAGQVLTTAAGIPGGLAFFWRGRRKLLLITFGALFVVGASVQIWAFQAFFAAMAAHS